MLKAHINPLAPRDAAKLVATKRPSKTGKPRRRYVLCTRNPGYPASLDRRKVYAALEDPRAAGHGLIRVIDESGEDYLYPSDWFEPIRVTERIRRALEPGRGASQAGKVRRSRRARQTVVC